MYPSTYYQEQLANAKTPLEEHSARTNLKKAKALEVARKQKRMQAQREATFSNAQITNTIVETAQVYDAVISEATVEDAPKKRGRKPKEQ